MIACFKLHFWRTVVLRFEQRNISNRFHSSYIHCPVGGHPLQWRYDERVGVSNHQPHGCLLNRLFGRRSKKTSKLRVTGLCVGNSPVTGEFPAQRPVTRNMFPFDDVIICGSGSDSSSSSTYSCSSSKRIIILVLFSQTTGGTTSIYAITCHKKRPNSDYFQTAHHNSTRNLCNLNNDFMF